MIIMILSNEYYFSVTEVISISLQFHAPLIVTVPLSLQYPFQQVQFTIILERDSGGLSAQVSLSEGQFRNHCVQVAPMNELVEGHYSLVVTNTKLWKILPPWLNTPVVT